MAIKVQCDHCGNIVNPDAYHHLAIYDHTPSKLNSAGLDANHGTGPGQETVEVHLCPICRPIWLERVKKLTEHTK